MQVPRPSRWRALEFPICAVRGCAAPIVRMLFPGPVETNDHFEWFEGILEPDSPTAIGILEDRDPRRPKEVVRRFKW